MADDKRHLVESVLKLGIRRAASALGLPHDELVLEDLKTSGLVAAINQSIKKNNVFRKRDFESIYQFSTYRNFLYYLIRKTRPRVVVETGVFHGLTTAWILQALEHNGSGTLISIDLPRRDWAKYFPGQSFGPGAEGEDELPADDLPGWIVPDALRSRWTLLLGPSSLHLERVLSENPVDLFIHDSDHSYDVMKFECELALSVRPDATVVIDDFDLNSYLFECLQKRQLHHCFMDDVRDDLSLSQCFAVVRRAVTTASPVAPAGT